MNAEHHPGAALLRPRARFYGSIPSSYERLNRELLELAPGSALEPAWTHPADWQEATTTGDLDQAVKVVPLPTATAPNLRSAAIQGMERLRQAGALTALRGNRPTDLPRPEAGRLDAESRRLPGVAELQELIGQIEAVLDGSHLFVRAVKLDDARASTTAVVGDRAAVNLHFDAEKSSLADYAEPVFQFYLNAGRLERQFQILPVLRSDLLNGFEAEERDTLPLASLLNEALTRHPTILETIPVESGSLAIFDGRQFAHDAGKSDVEALAAGQFAPSAEPDFVIALDTVETGYHQGLYRPELPFFEDPGCQQ